MDPHRTHLVLGRGARIGGHLFPLVCVVAVVSVVVETGHIAAGLAGGVGGGVGGGFTYKITILRLPYACLMSEINIIFS